MMATMNPITVNGVSGFNPGWDDRRFRVFLWMALGASPDTIAHNEFVARKTVLKDMLWVQSALRVTSASEAVCAGLVHGILETSSLRAIPDRLKQGYIERLPPQVPVAWRGYECRTDILSREQALCLIGFVAGASIAQMAAKLGESKASVERIQRRMRAQMGAQDNAAAVAEALACRILNARARKNSRSRPLCGLHASDRERLHQAA